MGLINEARNLYKSNFLPAMNLGAGDNLEKSEAVREPLAMMEDPFALLDAMGHKERPSNLSYDVLRRMATRNAVVSAIIVTRVNQVSTFTKPARFSRDGIGFEIRMRDPEAKVSKEDEDTILALEKFLEQTGFHRDMERDSFDTFVRKIVRDRLIYDQVAFEIVPDRTGMPAEVIALDASTIRLASENITPEAGKKLKKDETIKYVQLINGTITAQFTKDELAFATANPRSDVRVGGYGFSELEMLIHQITSHLWAEEYNSRFFSQGGTTKGILNLKGTANNPVSRAQLANFKRQWVSQVSGMTGAWKTPVLSIDGLEYINVSQSNREMEFEKWLNYLINIACAVYQVDPAEINFPNRGGATGSGGGGLGEGGIEDRLKNSKDKGLRPLLRFIESVVNRHIVTKFDEKFVFNFVGFDTKSEKETLEQQQMASKFKTTINELRAEDGQEPIKGGDIILDPAFIQHLGMMQQAEMMGGMPGEGPDEDDAYDADDYLDEEPDAEELARALKFYRNTLRKSRQTQKPVRQKPSASHYIEIELDDE